MMTATTRCEECHIGIYRPSPVPFLHLLGGRMMVVPDAPAYVCDVCGDVYYDDDFTSKVQYLLDRLADSVAKQGKAARPAAGEKPYEWQSGRRSS